MSGPNHRTYRLGFRPSDGDRSGSAWPHFRYGTASLFAALDVATGTVIGQHLRRHRHQEFLRFLKTIDKNTPADLDLHLICDVTAWIDAWNTDPKPFVWVKTADEILDNLAQYCTRINQLSNDSAHQIRTAVRQKRVHDRSTVSPTTMRSCAVARTAEGYDEFGNPEGRAFDLGGGDEDRIRGERILLYQCAIIDGPVAEKELQRLLAERGLTLDVRREPRHGDCDLTGQVLSQYTQLWFVSGRTPTLSAQQVQMIGDFVSAGNGLAIWADNEPYYADANLLAEALIGTRFSGNKKADRVMVPGPQRSPGCFVEHQLTQGVNNLYEGITICTIHPATGVTILGQSHDGQLCLGCYEDENRRIVLDTGFTKLYADRLHRSAGLGRYLSNIAFWLAKGSRDVEYRLLTTGRSEIPAVGPGATSPPYPFDIGKPAATTCILQWSGPTTLELSVRAPDGTRATHRSSQSPIRVGLQAYLPGTWSAEVTGVDVRSAPQQYVLTASFATDVRAADTTRRLEAPKDEVGQIVMPFYVLCDVSGSMAPDLAELNDGLRALHRGLLSEPVINDLVMMSVITFNDSARTVVPLAAPEDMTLPALPTPVGLTNYSAAFREFHQAFEADRARLKGEGKRVYRPCVYFLTDGEPTDHNYLQTFQALLTHQNNPAYPYICVFGFRDARPATLEALAHADAGGPHKRGRWFVAERGQSVSQTLTALVGVIGKSILQSAQSASGGVPEVSLPMNVPGMTGDRSSRS